MLKMQMMNSLPEPHSEPANRPPRLDGLDVARGIAFIGMVLVNFGVVMAFGNRNPTWVRYMLDCCTGRAAALSCDGRSASKQVFSDRLEVRGQT